MKEWAYTFDSVSKEQWIRQIESDLRQKSIASLQSEWWPGEPLIPLLHRDDVNHETVILPASLFTQPPTIAEWISTSGQDASTINRKVLDALRQDTQSLILSSADTSNWFNEEWFNGVFRDLITVSFEIKDYTVGFNPPVKIGPKDLLRINREAPSPIIEKLLTTSELDLTMRSSMRFIYRIESSGIWDINTALILNRLLSDLADWTKMGYKAATFLNQCVLSLEADKTYFKQIIQTRAIHLLWQNLIAHLIPDEGEIPDQYLECHIYESAQESPDHFLIRASMSALAASLAGTQTLCIHQSSGEDASELYRRANRNIHHLLQLESSMYKGVDPMSGAYGIDYYTKAWTQQIWDALWR